MISLYVKNYCHNCPEFEPDVEKDTFYDEDFSGPTMNTHTKTDIYCKHRDRCASMIKFLKEEKEKKKKDE